MTAAAAAISTSAAAAAASAAAAAAFLSCLVAPTSLAPNPVFRLAFFLSKSLRQYTFALLTPRLPAPPLLRCGPHRGVAAPSTPPDPPPLGSLRPQPPSTGIVGASPLLDSPRLG